MERVQICKYVKNYSKIEKIQDEYEVHYCADSAENGIFLSVAHNENSVAGKYSIKYRCENISEKDAQNIMLFAYENSIGVSVFPDVLQDFSVKFCQVD